MGELQSDPEEIYRWIDTYQFSRQKKNINRDFSDAVPLAEILKQHFPKLVDLHNYAPKNSVAQKVVNWTTLQRKVLSKLKINVSKTSLEDLAKGEPGAIEKILLQVKQLVERQKRLKEEKDDETYYVEGLEGSMSDDIMQIKTKQGSKILKQKIVPEHIFDDMIKELDDKTCAISSLMTKLDHLEKMCKIKDEHIEDLKAQIKSLKYDLESNPARFISEMF